MSSNSYKRKRKCPLKPRTQVYFVVVCILIIGLAIFFGNKTSKTKPVDAQEQTTTSTVEEK